MKKILLFLVSFLLAVSVTYGDVTVSISGFAFHPSTVTINLGETITFKNFDGFSHGVEYVSGGVSFATSPTLSQNGTWNFIPISTGTYNYDCSIHHSSMPGSFTVNAPAGPTITTGTVSNLILCEGNSLTIPFTTTGTVSGFSAQLSDANGSFSTPISLTTTTSTPTSLTVTIHSGITPGTGYRVRVLGSTPATTGGANGQDISINVSNPLPSTLVSISPLGPICIGTPLTFTGLTAGISNAGFQWYRNNSLLGTTMNSIVITDAQDGEVGYAVVTGTTTGCFPTGFITTTTGYVSTISSAVTPSVSITATSSICAGKDFNVIVSPSGGGGAPIFTLFVDNVSVAGWAIDAALNNLQAGTHTIYSIMQSSLSCATVQTVFSNVLTVTVKALPVVPTISSGSSSNTLLSSAASGNQWLSTATGIIAGATAPSFSTTLSGIYKVIVTLNGCSVTSAGFNLSVTSSNTTTTSTVTGTTTGISDEVAKTKISIYPNPVAAKLMVATEQGVKKSEFQIKIYDLNQKLVLSQTFTEGICKGGKGKECLCPGLSEIDVTNLPEGLYILQITDGNTVLLSNKLAKQ